MLASLVLALPLGFAQDGGVFLSRPKAASAPDYYVIQPGDTLWDISTRFLGDAQAWPELWSVNEYITNPHWIYPGNRIYFRIGDTLTPPSAGVEEPTIVTEGYQPAAPTELPTASTETACDFPPLFESSFDGVKASSPGVLTTAPELNIRGEIFAADQLGMQLGEGAIVHVRMRRSEDVECGTLLAIYRRQGRLVRGSTGALGHVFRVLAVGQVLRVDGSTVTMRLRDSWSEVARGDVVGDPVPVELDLDIRPPEGDLSATVVARLTAEQRLASTGETVFLDHGTNDGIEVGSALFLVERRDGTNLDGPEDRPLPERVVGRVVVIRAEPGHSAAIVTDAARDVQVGARAVTIPNP